VSRTDVGESRLVSLQARFSIRFRAKSNSDLRRAQFVPNTPRTCGHSRLFGVRSFPLHVRKPPSQRLFGFVFQAGHASSILVTRSVASLLVNSPSAVPSYSNTQMKRIQGWSCLSHDHRSAMYRSALSGKTSWAAYLALLKLIKSDPCPIRAQYSRASAAKIGSPRAARSRPEWTPAQPTPEFTPGERAWNLPESGLAVDRDVHSCCHRR
jgi:hypothetical protein